MCSLRIYLRRGDLSEETGFWRRLFRRPLATHLIQEALNSGITHASLTYGNIGFAKGDKILSADATETGFDTLPVCVELVGPKPLLEQFVRDRKGHLRGATLVMLEGVHLQSMVAEDAPAPSKGRVEYVRVGASPDSTNVPSAEVQATPAGLSEPAKD
jgi:PII-like signaling protein